MKDNKFRAWDEYEKCMWDWDTLVSCIDNQQILLRGILNRTNGLTLLQFIGLKEHTANIEDSKEIYEGDIVRCWGGEYCQGYWEHDEIIIIKNMIYDCFMMGESEYIKLSRRSRKTPCFSYGDIRCSG